MRTDVGDKKVYEMMKKTKSYVKSKSIIYYVWATTVTICRCLTLFYILFMVEILEIGCRILWCNQVKCVVVFRTNNLWVTFNFAGTGY